MTYYCVIVCVSVVLPTIIAEDPDLPYISNYDRRCMKCICKATIGGCNKALGCIKGYCGPFRISKAFWMDSENITYSFQEEENIGAAYKKCTLDYQCSQRIVQQYFYRYSADCSGDGVTDCDDYAMLFINGRTRCDRPVSRTPRGKIWWERFIQCNNPLGEKIHLFKNVYVLLLLE